MMLEKDLSDQWYQILAEARVSYEQQWRVFGGEDGRCIGVEDIAGLLSAHRRVTSLQSGFSEVVQIGTLDALRGNPLLDVEPERIDFTNPAVQLYSRKWLDGEQVRLRLLEAFTRNRGEVPELRRRMTACIAAIGLLDAQLAVKRG